MYAKFRNFPLRVNKALGIFRIGVTTTRRRRTTRVGIRDAFQRLKSAYGLLNTKRAVTKLRIHIHDLIAERSAVSDV